MKTLVRIFAGVVVGVIVMAAFYYFGASDFTTGLFTGIFSSLASNIVYDIRKA